MEGLLQTGADVAAVVFDFDGTLVDTMPLHYEAYRRTFAEMNIELLPEHFYSAIGGTARETIPKFLRGRPASWSTEEIHAHKKRALVQVLQESELEVLPCGLLLPAFATRLPVALASSGSRPGIQMMLTRLKWTHYFDAIVSGEDAARGKPDPELFLLAARALGVPGESCLAFEDTDDGVASARAAGMRVFDVRRASAPQR